MKTVMTPSGAATKRSLLQASALQNGPADQQNHSPTGAVLDEPDVLARQTAAAQQQ